MEAEERLSEPTAQDSPKITDIYSALSSYPFDTDPDFQAGLASILSDTKANETDLILQAQCFYFARKFNTPAINSQAYQAWKKSTHSSTSTSTSTDSQTSETTINSSALPPPPYPTSFAAIAELITNNKPIPGIEEVPDTVLEHGSSRKDNVQRRRKPWEKDEVNVEPTPAPSARFDELESSTESETDGNVPSDSHEVLDGTERARRTGVGVMHILSPDAVPDSGLVAKD